MTAIADPPTDVLVSQPAREVVYASRRDALCLVHTPEYPILNAATGQRTGQTIGGVRIQFTDGQLRVPLEGEVVTAQGKRIPAPDLLAWLDKHPRHGDRDDGFFKLPKVAPPISDDEMERITEAAMLGDVGTLRSMLEQEQAGWNRPQITKVITKRLDQLAELLAQVAAQQAEEAPKAAAKPKPKAG